MKSALLILTLFFMAELPAFCDEPKPITDLKPVECDLSSLKPEDRQIASFLLLGIGRQKTSGSCPNPSLVFNTPCNSQLIPVMGW